MTAATDFFWYQMYKGQDCSFCVSHVSNTMDIINLLNFCDFVNYSVRGWIERDKLTPNIFSSLTVTFIFRSQWQIEEMNRCQTTLTLLNSIVRFIIQIVLKGPIPSLKKLR